MRFLRFNMKSSDFQKDFEKEKRKAKGSKEGKMFEREMRPLTRAMSSIVNAKTNIPAKWYVKEIYDTSGDYSNRDREIVSNVNKAVGAVKRSISHDKSLTTTPYGIIIKIQQILMDRKNSGTFVRAFKDSRGVLTNSDPAVFFTSMYTALVYAMESLTLVVAAEYHNMIDIRGKVSEESIDKYFVEKHRGYVKSVVLPALRLVAYIEETDLSKEYSSMTKQVDEAKKNNASQESLAAAIGIIGLVVATMWVGVWALRSIIYWMKVVKYDINEFLKEEMDFLDINIKEYQEKLQDTTDEKERKRIEKVIERQIKMRDRFLTKTEKMYKEETINEIEVEEVFEQDEKFEKSNSHAGDVSLSL